MRNRGTVYWGWANPELHFRNYDERLSCGTLINVQVRTSTLNVTQLFFGIYGAKGLLLLEESHPDCRGQTMTAAMAWGLQRACDWIAAKFPPSPAVRPESLPRRGSRLAE